MLVAVLEFGDLRFLGLGPPTVPITFGFGSSLDSWPPLEIDQKSLEKQCPLRRVKRATDGASSEHLEGIVGESDPKREPKGLQN